MSQLGLGHSCWANGNIPFDRIVDMQSNYLRDECSGAIQLFLGIVRADIIEHEPVQYIEYTAYSELAEQALEQIRIETIQEFGLTYLYIEHSLGKVNAGDISLLIICSSKHRPEETGMMHQLVQRIKDEVPVWGRECTKSHEGHWKKCTHLHHRTHTHD